MSSDRWRKDLVIELDVLVRRWIERSTVNPTDYAISDLVQTLAQKFSRKEQLIADLRQEELWPRR